jgi:hypothetical protein
MADDRTIASVGTSLERLLSARLLDEPAPVAGARTIAMLAGTNDLRDPGRLTPPCLTIFLYRVGHDTALPALDLHYLLTAWADAAADEQRILGRAMQCLETTPVLTAALLTADGVWGEDERVPIVFEDLPTDGIARVFEALGVGFRLSVAYRARVVRAETSRGRFWGGEGAGGARR